MPGRPSHLPLATAAVVVAALTAACGGSGNSSSSAGTPSSGATVTIALGGPLSGPEKPTGDQLMAGAKLAVDEVNKAGGISAGPRKGAKLALKPYDDADDPAKAASAMRDIVGGNDVVAFVGSGLSDASIAAAPIASRAGLAYLSAYASSPKILEAATAQKSVFVVPPTFPAYSRSVTNELIAAGHRRPAVLHLMGTYGEGITRYVDERLKEGGVTPVSETSFTFTDKDFRAQLAKAKAARPDSLVMVGLADSDAAILKQAAELGLKVPAYDPGGITNSDTFLKDAGALADGVVGNTPSDAQRATPAAQALRSGYSAATGESVVPDPAAFSYEAVKAIAAAFADGASGRGDLATHLHQIKLDDTGVGPLSFSADGSRIGGILYVFRVSGGKPAFTGAYQQSGPDAVTKAALQH